MSLSSESILDHIADYLKFSSGTQFFWYTLDTSYNHDCHLASWFRLEPNDYKVLLVVASLASLTQCSGNCSYMEAAAVGTVTAMSTAMAVAMTATKAMTSVRTTVVVMMAAAVTVMATVMVVGVAMAMATVMAVMATPPTVAVVAMVKALKTTIN
jgi:hypothetical protein